MFHGEASYAFIMGIISGYPVGAKIINKFIEDEICTKSEAERMLAFTNNSGPLFIIGTVGISLFGDKTLGAILFLTHILSCLTVGLIFGFVSRHVFIKDKLYRTETPSNYYKLSDLGTILSNSITNAISTILLIGGFIVLFSIIISILNNLYIIDYLSSFLEIINIPRNICKMYSNWLIRAYKRCKCYFINSHQKHVNSNNNMCFLIRIRRTFNFFTNI